MRCAELYFDRYFIHKRMMQSSCIKNTTVTPPTCVSSDGPDQDRWYGHNDTPQPGGDGQHLCVEGGVSGQDSLEVGLPRNPAQYQQHERVHVVTHVLGLQFLDPDRGGIGCDAGHMLVCHGEWNTQPLRENQDEFSPRTQCDSSEVILPRTGILFVKKNTIAIDIHNPIETNWAENRSSIHQLI